ncbi:hypothetical protein [Labrenzia sp. DG1229]|uniref:hypothetical protein n=1 Tax=Labrenzia sp. DG1229 TaxID=681847 RepID=UPI0012EB613E|nr:hypothetical protein [Labrenzia sp. DG1229]
MQFQDIKDPELGPDGCDSNQKVDAITRRSGKTARFFCFKPFFLGRPAMVETVHGVAFHRFALQFARGSNHS